MRTKLRRWQNLQTFSKRSRTRFTAKEQGAEIESCLIANAATCGEYETTRNETTCNKCSADIAAEHVAKLGTYKQNLILAAEAECFDAAIISAIASRLTTFGEELGK